MKFNSKLLHSRLIRHLREWHRKLGIMAAFFIIFLSLSGVALNHTTTLSLAHQPISNLWLLDLYGISPPNDVRIYQVNSKQKQNTLRVGNNLLWLNNHLLMKSSTEIIAATLISSALYGDSPIILVVKSNQISLFNLQGDLIDQLGEDFGVPTNISAIKVNQESIIFKTASGYFQSDSSFLVWQEVAFVREPSWLSPSEVSETLKAKIELAYRSQFLTLERIILDAHSGRIFGLFGVFFMDAVAILLILLSVSGIYIWLRYANAKR